MFQQLFSTAKRRGERNENQELEKFKSIINKLESENAQLKQRNHALEKELELLHARTVRRSGEAEQVQIMITTKPKVVLSATQSREAEAKALILSLQSENVTVFWNDGIQSDSTGVVDKLKNCSLFVPLADLSWANSRQHRYETNIAQGASLAVGLPHILPIMGFDLQFSQRSTYPLLDGLLYNTNAVMFDTVQNVSTQIRSALSRMGMSTTRPIKIMLSYNWSIQEQVKQLHEILKNAGYNIWIDVEQLQGNIVDTMANAVETSDIIVACVSKRYQESANAKMEFLYSVNSGKAIVVVSFDPIPTLTGWLGFALHDRNVIDFSQGQGIQDEHNMQLLLAEIAQVAAKAQSSSKSKSEALEDTPQVEVVPDVMISFRVGTRKSEASELKAALEVLKLNVWICIDTLEGGDEFRSKIVQSAKSCKVFVPLIDVGWVESGECRYETNVAQGSCLANGLPQIFPVVGFDLDVVERKKYPILDGLLYNAQPEPWSSPLSLAQKIFASYFAQPLETTAVSPTKPIKIMLSYNWSIQEQVKQLHEILKNAGYNIWIDVEQLQGNIVDAMANAVETSDIIVACVSKRYQESANAKMEFLYSVNSGKDIVVVSFDPISTLTGWLGFALHDRNVIDFSQGQGIQDEHNMQLLLAEIAQVAAIVRAR